MTSAPAPSLVDAIVYAPGMTCVYNQLFAGISSTPWLVCPFKKDFEGTPNRLNISGDDTTSLLLNIMSGNIYDSFHVFENPETIYQRTGPIAQFDTLIIESRWLMYDNSLLENIDWNTLKIALSRFAINKNAYFIDVDYPHIGSLFDLSLVRSCSADDVAQLRRRNDLKNNLLSVLSGFKKFTYVDVTAIAGYLGYKHSCTDQIDHYSSSFREYLLAVFSRDTDASTFNSNSNLLAKLTERLIHQSVDIEFVQGMAPTSNSGDTLLGLRIFIQSEDQLVCPSELQVSWIALTHVSIDWSCFHSPNGNFNCKQNLRPDWLINYVHKLININTMGQFELKITE